MTEQKLWGERRERETARWTVCLWVQLYGKRCIARRQKNKDLRMRLAPSLRPPPFPDKNPHWLSLARTNEISKKPLMWPDSWPCSYHARRKGVCRDWEVFQNKTVSSNKVKVTREYSGLGDESLRALPRNQERNKNRIVVMFIWNSIWDPCQGNTIKKQKRNTKSNMKNSIIIYGWYALVCIKLKWVTDWISKLTETLEKLYT